MRHDIEEEDMLAVVGRMKNGVIFSLDPSWSRAENRLKVPGPGWEVFPKRMEVNLVIHGSDGSMCVDCFGPNTYHNGCPDNKYTVQYTYFDEWVGLIDEFVECIATKKLPKINLGWHKDTIKAMNAVYESIATGKAVHL
jgi:predicted dehydrogenase